MCLIFNKKTSAKKTIKYTENAGFFCIHFKKHNCPKCGGRVQVRYISKHINAKSPEAKDFDLLNLTEDIELRTIYFYCPICRIDISLDDMKNFERKNSL